MSSFRRRQQNVARLSAQDLALGGAYEASWHYRYRENDEVYVGGVADELGVYAKSGRMLQSFINEIGNGDWKRDRGPAALPVNAAEADARVEKIATWQTDLIQLNRVTQAWPTATPETASLVDVRGPGAPLGASGLVLGPRFHIVDQDGLVDAFLARQPYSASGFHWRIGHFSRPLPDGYFEAITTNNPLVLTDSAQALELRNLWKTIRPQPAVSAQ